MKKQIFNTAVGLVILAFSLASCQQKKTESTSVKPNYHSQSAQPDRWYSPGFKRCVATADDCYPDCEKDNFTALIGAIEGGPAGISEYFNSNDGRGLSDEVGLSSTHLSALQSGDYTIEASEDPLNSNSTYFIVGPSATFDNTDPEFVFQLHTN